MRHDANADLHVGIIEGAGAVGIHPHNERAYRFLFKRLPRGDRLAYELLGISAVITPEQYAEIKQEATRFGFSIQEDLVTSPKECTGADIHVELVGEDGVIHGHSIRGSDWVAHRHLECIDPFTLLAGELASLEPVFDGATLQQWVARARAEGLTIQTSHRVNDPSLSRN